MSKLEPQKFIRIIKPYAKPVLAEDLRDGEVYFSVQFADRKLKIPNLAPLILVGRNLSNGDTNCFYFQEYGSYSRGIKWDDPNRAPDEGGFYVQSSNELNHIFEYENALDVLIWCALQRKSNS